MVVVGFVDYKGGYKGGYKFNLGYLFLFFLQFLGITQ